MTKDIVGLTEPVTVIGNDGTKKKVIARIDSGATKSAIDVKLAAELKLGPIVKTKLVKSTHGNTLRAVVEAKIKIAGKTIKSQFTIADRTDMKFRVLAGQNLLKKAKVLIDPRKVKK